MSIKWIGAAMLSVGCFLYGYLLATDLKKRREELQYVGQLLLQLKSEITYKQSSLEAACLMLAKQAKEPYRTCFLSLEQRMQEQGWSFELAWKMALTEVIQNTRMKEKDLKCIEEIALFGEAWDKSLLLGLLERCMEEMTRQLKSLEMEYERKGKTYLYLGGCTGIGLVILLL